MVANGEIGIFVWILEIVGTVGIIHWHHGRSEQCIDKTVGDASREGGGVEHLLLRCGEPALFAASVSGIDTELQVLQQLPFSVGVEVVALET